ncbi:MAG TPA: hypothetical protein VHK69_18910, partial [Chitinophagaceae bacterium]|nr:hypothetical protein [Chitinophagaceae bacterium]
NSTIKNAGSRNVLSRVQGFIINRIELEAGSPTELINILGHLAFHFTCNGGVGCHELRVWQFVHLADFNEIPASAVKAK